MVVCQFLILLHKKGGACDVLVCGLSIRRLLHVRGFLLWGCFVYFTLPYKAPTTKITIEYNVVLASVTDIPIFVFHLLKGTLR